MTKKHAPRGRIKARSESDPINGETTGRPGQCVATNKKRGDRCQKQAIAGGTVCRFHGGAAPQVKAAAAKRLLALQHPAIDCLSDLIAGRKEYPSVAYQAARDVLDRTMGQPGEAPDLQGGRKPPTPLVIVIQPAPPSASAVTNVQVHTLPPASRPANGNGHRS